MFDGVLAANGPTNGYWLGDPGKGLPPHLRGTDSLESECRQFGRPLFGQQVGCFPWIDHDVVLDHDIFSIANRDRRAAPARQTMPV
jgi:hypothetical protein